MSMTSSGKHFCCCKALRRFVNSWGIYAGNEQGQNRKGCPSSSSHRIPPYTLRQRSWKVFLPAQQELLPDVTYAFGDAAIKGDTSDAVLRSTEGSYPPTITKAPNGQPEYMCPAEGNVLPVFFYCTSACLDKPQRSCPQLAYI